MRAIPAQLEEFRMAVQDLLDTAVIRESCSPYASPVVLVRKKDGSLRVCVDFRKLNAKTIKDAYPIPRITETLEALHGANWFCSLGLQSGYLQVGVRVADKADFRGPARCKLVLFPGSSEWLPASWCTCS